METIVKTFKELTIEELYELLQLRNDVFIVEQECAYQDLDGKDFKAFHVLGRKENKLVAYARIFKPGDYHLEASIGRVVVKPAARGKGYGKIIMLEAMKAVMERFKTSRMSVSAQSYLKDFYNELQFKARGDEYLEDGIPHIMMYHD